MTMLALLLLWIAVVCVVVTGLAVALVIEATAVIEEWRDRRKRGKA